MVSLHGQHGARARAIGFFHGMAAYGTGLSWLYQLFGIFSVLLWCVLAAFTALFADMQSRAERRGIAGWKLAAFTALNWCGWEFIRAELFPLKFPWMTTGLSVGPNALLPWTGVYGVSCLVVLGVALLVGKHWKFALPVFTVILAAIFLPSRVPPIAPGEAGSVRTAGLQFEGVALPEFVERTRQLPPDIRHVVWPEYAVPYDILRNERDWELLKTLCREKNITLTFGTQASESPGDGWRNIALTMDGERVLGTYNKVHTVHLFNDGIAGSTTRSIATPSGPIGTPICFDCDYEGVVRGMTAAGAETFMVPVMDAQNWTARQHDQHAELFRIRACENGRWMFVCATSGVSQVIDPKGLVHQRLGALQQGVITGTIQRENKLTFYTRYGWLVPWCLLAAAAMGWGTMILMRKNPDLTNNHQSDHKKYCAKKEK